MAKKTTVTITHLCDRCGKPCTPVRGVTLGGIRFRVAYDDIKNTPVPDLCKDCVKSAVLDCERTVKF